MKTFVMVTAALFTTSVLVFATAANAAGDCPFGHSTKTAQSSNPILAETPAPQTPAPGG